MRWSGKPSQRFNRSPWSGIKPVGIEPLMVAPNKRQTHRRLRRKLPFSGLRRQDSCGFGNGPQRQPCNHSVII
jgi:hypothetical protein